MTRIVVISDPHLSPSHGFFWGNWRHACGEVNKLAPDAVVVSGDLCINGPDSDAEVAFAHEALRHLEPPVYAIPGNHDVGDEPPGQEADQLIDEPRLQRWMSVFGTDRFAFETGRWRILGINAQLLGSGLPRESEQDAWLDGELSASSQPIMLILHKPLFLQSPDETEVTASSINCEPRARLLDRLRHAPVRVVVSGHLHCAVGAMRDRLVAGEPADLVILSRPLVEVLAREGHVDGASARDLGTVATAIAVRASDPIPALDDTEALRRTLLAADAVHFPDPAQATAGIHFARVLEKLGLKDHIADRLHPAPDGATAMRALAASRARRPLGCTQATEILVTPGIVLAAPLPHGCDLSTVYTAAITAKAAAPREAAALITMLASPSAAALRQRLGFT